MGKEYKPKLGDWVVITKSDDNWGLGMDAFVGKVYKILSNPEFNTIFFEAPGDMRNWQWNYKQGHFRKAELWEIPLEPRLKILQEYAKKHYPVGTTYKNSVNLVTVHTILGQNFKWWVNDTYKEGEALQEENSFGLIWTKRYGWGEITSNIDDTIDIVFEEDTIYHAETEEEANMLLKEADRQGFKWSTGHSYIEKNNWNDYYERTCYWLSVGTYCSLEYFKSKHPKVSVIKVKDLFSLNKKENGTKNQESSSVISTVDSVSGRTGGQEIKSRTKTVRDLCESGSFKSGREVTETRRNRKRPKAEVGDNYLQKR